ncbi:2-amino-4-hydroxy-6-hydroxymethyldihydropteridine diphosphokinase [Staphylococcus pragensis]|uniref:2-amino-4-hydroxy-6-hydroxymethyldihydropteridine diphosphokinase n=1 Tax=Staphylococcus pragensis TaxID=1611836 RepID=A0A4Z1B528_9STAP|nr:MULTISPECIES: 2-amino-4-hydroxy-6-hydroxymethyldihydropteridine diphosphokinase [Staphylococcus]RTX88507.1 2-amino-4-hydroxy-6-hydroxymethyldihydropteridine diphosphokinase [Staphylococcus carnosus]TGN23004.1 2-amino-4-hydroxy-6-hydroxymethyldihydropteridine diphosphokinase [Staphylococcus pragensis]GGG98271.1 2-amino-4-hydroxy-6-hydroxymethyldihydropteridine diphosphokinase [Staphylococcus pragensis]
MVQAYLGLGSNIGDREQQLQEAIRLIDSTEGIDVVQTSPIYETAPVGYTDQPNFLNLCIEINTELSSQALLQRCLETEQHLHRVRDIRWGPRTLDVDILLYGDEVVEEEDLSIPHPRMNERAFVLIPLNDIAPNKVEPRSHQTIGELVMADDTVKKYKD